MLCHCRCNDLALFISTNFLTKTFSLTDIPEREHSMNGTLTRVTEGDQVELGEKEKVRDGERRVT